MKQPSVTILLTVRNSAGTIKKCVDSLLNQDYKNKKIYVTDAFSTDGTYEILKKFGKKIKLEQVRGNMAIAYNHMLKKVNTEFVAFIDGDAIAEKDWLTRLIDAFEEDSVAVGGKPLTPKTKNKLQELIGKELEFRFNKLPKYVSRLPTMNLCVRTEYAKKVIFRADLDVVQETEWGYRLTKYGKMIYEPAAVVWHHHRATWKSYFKQQMNYAKFVPTAYRSHKRKATGDEITPGLMVIQIPLLYLAALFFILSFSKMFHQLWQFTFGFLCLLYVYMSALITTNISDFFYLILIFFVRNIAWCIGGLIGLPKVFK